MNTIESNLKTSVLYYDTAKELWDDLKERFSVANGLRIQQLKANLAECKQRGPIIAEYSGKLKTLWDELASYEHMVTCICSGCKCELKKHLQSRREEERVHQFLTGLDDAVYGTATSNILATEPLPSLNRIYSTMVQEERLQTATRATEERREVVALVAQTHNNGRGRGNIKDNNNLSCTHCNRKGHEAGGYFLLIGYPGWWGDRPRTESKGYCRNSHPRAGRGRGGARANAAQTVPGADSLASGSSDTAATPPLGLSSDEWHILMEMLNRKKAGATNDRTTAKQKHWILDTGVSNHMTGDLENLIEPRDIQWCPIRMPDGGETHAKKEGSVKLNEELILSNVLFVPGLTCNLKSVSQLTDVSQVMYNSLIFVRYTGLHLEDAIIHDCTSKTLIGACDRRDGLYYF